MGTIALITLDKRSNMEYRQFGKTGIKVSKLSFGASALGGVFRNVHESRAIRAVHTALDAGINYFDVAPAYGATRSETILGKALKEIPRGNYYISTKVGKHSFPDREDDLDYSEASIRKSLDESSRRLGIDYFDILHLHDIEYQHRIKLESALSEGYETLQKLKKEGRIGGVSFGIYPMDLWQRIVADFEIDAMLVHNHYCLNDTRALELLPATKEKGIAFINASPFGSGLLTGRQPPDWHPVEESQLRYFEEAIRFCKTNGVPISKLALQFSTANPDIPTTMFASASPDSVKRNIAWIDEKYEGELIEEVRKILAPVADTQWDYDAGLDRMRARAK